MADEDNVLFIRGIGNKNPIAEDEDVWDDSALIQAYDKAVNLAKEEVTKRIGVNVEITQQEVASQNSKQHRQASNSYKKWTVGAPCRAIYSEDGEIYEAVILKVHQNSGKCTVKFVGYGNTEQVQLSSLFESDGLQSQIAQKKTALGEKFNDGKVVTDETNCSTTSSSRKYNGLQGERMDCEFEEAKTYKNNFMPGPPFNTPFDMMPPAPPLPPQLMAKLPENDADALSSMLMSWYISGFHTGYYHGLKHARNNEGKRKS